MKDVTIAVSGADDIAVLVNLVNRTYRGENSRKGWTHEADLLSGQRIDANELTTLLADKNTTVLKYTLAGSIVGCVCLEKKGNHLYLGMLTADPELQGKGIGKAILRASEAYAAIWGCAKIEMTVITDRKELIGWYERRGYKQTDVVKPFPSDNPKVGKPVKPLAFVVMEKAI